MQLMIARTPFMLSDFHLFVLQTHNKPPSPVLPPPLFILSCCVVEVRYGHGQAGSTQERRIQSDWREFLGVDFRQPLGEFEESGRGQSSRDESTGRGKVLLDTPL